MSRMSCSSSCLNLQRPSYAFCCLRGPPGTSRDLKQSPDMFKHIRQPPTTSEEDDADFALHAVQYSYALFSSPAGMERREEGLVL
eukprot:6302994-Pyramimonas_sp.AAC.1